jgi:hypothetical protein
MGAPRISSCGWVAGLRASDSGRLSRGKVAEILGLSFHEVEDLFHQSRIPYPIKSGADDDFDNASLRKAQ